MNLRPFGSAVRIVLASIDNNAVGASAGISFFAPSDSRGILVYHYDFTDIVDVVVKLTSSAFLTNTISGSPKFKSDPNFDTAGIFGHGRVIGGYTRLEGDRPFRHNNTSISPSIMGPRTPMYVPPTYYLMFIKTTVTDELEGSFIIDVLTKD